ncbi:MAG: hypothetical protein IT289_04745 [Oligoflexia bacterium]|nr:hypothetical protein [Oligoflexia bacterium]
MKLTFMTSIFALLASFQAFGADPSLAYCRNADFEGRHLMGAPYQAAWGNSQARLEISQQNGCDLTISDNFNKAIWKFDLSGVRPAIVPESIISANGAGGAFAQKALTSLKIYTKLAVSDSQKSINAALPDRIQIVATMDLPKEGPNLFESKVKFTSEIWINYGPQSKRSWSKSDPEGNYPTPRLPAPIQNLYFTKLESRLVRVNDAKLPGKFGDAFSLGVNYVAEKLLDAAFLHQVRFALSLSRSDNRKLAE